MMPRGINVDWSHLAEDYATLGGQKAVAREYGCTAAAVSKQMVKRGIPVKGIDWTNLEADYFGLRTQTAVAKKYGCKPSSVQQQLKKRGITSNPYDRNGVNNPKWRGGRRKDPDGYIQIYCPNHPHCNVRKEVCEHRLVMEKKIGRYLDSAEIVHHLNGIKDDNRPENLELVGSIGEHVYGTHHEMRVRDSSGRFVSIQEAYING